MSLDFELGIREQVSRFRDLRRGGWKVGMTSGAMRDSMGTGIRPFGHILHNRIYRSGVVFPFAHMPSLRIETELCFKFRHGVDETTSIAAVEDAIESVAPAFELNEQRISSAATVRDRLADNLSQWGIVVGAGVSDWQDIDLEALAVSLHRDGQHTGTVAARGHIDDHIQSICALAVTLKQVGYRIEPDDCVITGSFVRKEVVGVSKWVGNFGDEIGTVTASWV